ncbi:MULTISPECIES: hypothetical protein [Flammeovirga]|uniref:Co-chaperone DjlA N-terminal domain-containing protein n=1 Tax=Flammeovirga agarivorans TaxID=2726742 RepID=A0A7X8XVI8_9BACT|nr:MULTISPECIES: hypothetical protein [Flammeovirga]NLR91100.1 hypothetical protein [Flammeovirga agarivorans]
MSAHKKTEELYAQYIATNNVDISREHFQTLFTYFPCLLIVASDGVVDEEEWVFVKYLSKFMADAYKSSLTKPELDSLQKTYFQELEYLVKSLDKWKEPFLDTLHSYLEENDDEKEDILDILHLFAEASDGVCDDEEEAIEELTERLNLE